MEKINSPREFAALIKDYKKNHKKVLSNCFFLPDEVEYMTKQQKLFVESREDLLCFYTEEADCWRLYYYMEAGMPVAIEKKRQTSDSGLCVPGRRGRKTPRIWKRKLDQSRICSI